MSAWSVSALRREGKRVGVSAMGRVGVGLRLLIALVLVLVFPFLTFLPLRRPRSKPGRLAYSK